MFFFPRGNLQPLQGNPAAGAVVAMTLLPNPNQPGYVAGVFYNPSTNNWEQYGPNGIIQSWPGNTLPDSPYGYWSYGGSLFGRNSPAGWVLTGPNTQTDWYGIVPVDSDGYPIGVSNQDVLRAQGFTAQNAPSLAAAAVLQNQYQAGIGINQQTAYSRPTQGGNMQGYSATPNLGGGNNANAELMNVILALNPPITTLSTRVTADQAAATAGVAAANTYQAAICQLVADTQDFLGAQSLVGNTALANLASGGSQQANIASISLIGLQSQCDSLRALSRTLMTAAAGNLIAAQPAAIGPALAPWVTGWSALAQNIIGFLGSLGGGLGTGSLGAALLLAQGGNAFGGQGPMLEALTVGPAITTFTAACTTANTALLAAGSLAATNTALITWTSALVTFLGALSSATVIGGVIPN